MCMAILGLTNTLSLFIRVTEDGDKVQYRYSNENEWSEEIDIQYTLETDDDDDSMPYFMIGTEPYLISEFMRMED